MFEPTPTSVSGGARSGAGSFGGLATKTELAGPSTAGRAGNRRPGTRTHGIISIGAAPGLGSFGGVAADATRPLAKSISYGR